MQSALILEVPPGFGPGNEGFADLYLTRYCGHISVQNTICCGLGTKDKAAFLRKDKIYIYASVAQPVEQLSCNQQVVGSSPTGGSFVM